MTRLSPTTPCRECPFRRKSLPGYVGGHSDPIEIVDLVNHDQKFPCHMDVNAIRDHLLDELGGSDDDPLTMSDDQAFEQATREARHCVGALIFMNQSCKSSRNPLIAALQDTVGTSPEVFETNAEYLTHHKSKEYLKRLESYKPAPPKKTKSATRKPSRKSS